MVVDLWSTVAATDLASAVSRKVESKVVKSSLDETKTAKSQLPLYIKE